MKYKQWVLTDPPSSAALSALTAGGIPPLVAAVLCARGITTPEGAAAFLATDEVITHDPLLLRDMPAAVARVEEALARREPVAVYGDYDVDGITSTCLLTHYLRSRGGNVTPYIPDRLEEGYGVSKPALDTLHAAGVTLVITVDCGITAVEETAYAAALGMELIITDHHECKAELPEAVAVIDPHRPDCPYPFKDLAGVGVALKLVLALGGEARRAALLDEYADLATVGTVADVMRLVGENRALVRMGLGALDATRRPGLRALLCEAGLSGKPLTSASIGYTLAPRINASGRMGCADLATELLLTEDVPRSEELARKLCDLNRERQSIEAGIFEACVQLAEAAPPRERFALVLASHDWHQGVVGIVASRLTEKYACPAFMICLQDGKGKGSCRSFGGFNLFAALEECTDLLEGFGGHEFAAGFTIAEENIPAFRARMNAIVSAATGGEEMVSSLRVDAALTDGALLTQEGVAALDLLEPYGSGNVRPVFLLSGCTVDALSEVGGGRHLKLRVGIHGRALDAIFFSATAEESALAVGDRADLVFYPQCNEFRGRTSVQLLVSDLRPAQTRAQSERALYEKYCRGERLTPAEALALTPSRAEFAGVWRYLKGRPGPRPPAESPLRLVKNVARATGLRETYLHTMVCLEVFRERGLMDIARSADSLQIALTPTVEKVDLEQSAIMVHLREIVNHSC